MRILITHAYTPENKGDAAILSVLLLQLSKAFPDSQIVISIFDQVSKNERFDGYILISNIMYASLFINKSILIKFLYSLYICVVTILWASIYRIFKVSITFFIPKIASNEIENLLESDLVIPTGGGYIRAEKGFRETINLIITLHSIVLAIILDKKVILYTQSIGPFKNKFQRFITKAVLNKVNLILVREDHTVSTLHSIGVNKQIIIKTVDAGFIFKSNGDLKLSDFIDPTILRKSNMVVGVTARQWLKKTKQEFYERSIAKFIDKLVKWNPSVLIVFIPQVSSSIHNDDDRMVATRISRYINQKDHVINLTGSYTHHELKQFYSKIDFLVGTRFHSVIFAISSFVPSLAIEYEYKTGGIMKDLGLSKWVIPIEKVTSENLFSMFLELVKGKKQYVELLKETLPVYVQEIEENIGYLQNAYYNVPNIIS